MFDHVTPMLPAGALSVLPPPLATAGFDPGLPFALTSPNRHLAPALSGAAHPVVLDRFSTLTEAMEGAIGTADAMAPEDGAQILAVLDREDRLVLAGLAASGGVAWCHPVQSAIEARTVVTEASALRAQALRASDWREADLAARLRQRADLLEARLVDPLWRAFVARALQIAA
ncbi:MAG: DNA repair protein RadC [Tabrizicola sp.]